MIDIQIIENGLSGMYRMACSVKSEAVPRVGEIVFYFSQVSGEFRERTVRKVSWGFGKDFARQSVELHVDTEEQVP